MNSGEQACQKCSGKIPAGKVTMHGIRCGYSAAHFPLFIFEKVPLCPGCLERQQKIDVFEKILAVITLGIVLYFLAVSFVIIFSAGS